MRLATADAWYGAHRKQSRREALWLLQVRRVYAQITHINQRNESFAESFAAWKLKFDEEFGIVQKEAKITGLLLLLEWSSRYCGVYSLME